MPSPDALLAELLSGDEQRAERAATQLVDHPQALDPLIELSKDPDPDKRWWSCRALSAFTAPQAGQAVLSLLADRDVEVQQCAALALTTRPQPAALTELIDLLASEDSLLARLVGDALIALKAEAVPALIAALEVELQQAQTEAARALALIGDTRAVPALFKLLDSKSTLLEHWANEGLEKMGVGMTFFQTS
jgi:HEAT repeat protein